VLAGYLIVFFAVFRRLVYNHRFFRSRLSRAPSAAHETAPVPGSRGSIQRFNSTSRGSTMYAVIKTGGKQYKVAAGEKLKVEQIPADIGAEITLDQVLAVGAGDQIKFGTPLVSGASVKATVIAQVVTTR
jgi:hypothetical protein